MRSKRTILAVLLAILAMAVCAGTSYAQTVTFTLNLSCDTSHDPNCPHSNLTVAGAPGGVASDSVPIATVNSDVTGYTQPVPVSGGLLRFFSSPATRVMCDPPPGGCYAIYDNPGGAASITGSVFGLPSGAALLTGSFQGGAQSHYNLTGSVTFGGQINVSYINPVILANLGLAGASTCGRGSLSDAFDFDTNNGIETFSVSVTFTPGACPYSYSVVHNFTGGMDGAAPFAGLTFDTAGNLYGTAWAGGAGYGTAFKLIRRGSAWIFNPLYSFAGGNDGSHPGSPVIIGADGNIYGTTEAGGSGECNSAGYPGCGTVFKLKPPPAACKTALCPWTEKVLHTFTGGSDGAYSFGNVISDGAGNLYGTTGYGGIYGDCDNYDGFGCGTAYELMPSGGNWNESVLWNFGNGRDGQSPYTGLVFDKSGNLYGTTVTGGQYGKGTVFQLTPSGSGWTENVLYSFQGGNDGSGPYAGLIMDQSGNLYGATPTGGQAGGGTVFELTPSGSNWTFTALYSFPGVAGTNTGPYASLVMDSTGSLYGTTIGNFGQGGDYGTVFKLTNLGGSGWAYTLLYSFTGGSDGEGPSGNLILDPSGNVYGTAPNGGAYGYGVVFEVKLN